MFDSQDRKAYGKSLFVHISAAAMLFLFSYIGKLIYENREESKLVFELVEPTLEQKEQMPPLPSLPELKVEKFKDLEPIEIPEPEELDLTEPEDEQEPEPVSEPKKPEPKPAPKKMVEKPAPKPKKISYADFRKENPAKKTSTTKPRARRTPTKIESIKVGGALADIKYSSAAADSASASASAAMMNAMQAYARYINNMAKSKWRLPSNCAGMDLSAKIEFKVTRAGGVTNIVVVRSSGNREFDRSVVDVFFSLVLNAPPSGDSVVITLVFDSQV